MKIYLLFLALSCVSCAHQQTTTDLEKGPLPLQAVRSYEMGGAFRQ